MNNNCPNCNTVLKYLQNENILICDQCGSKFSIKTSNSFYKICTCKKCNLEFITDKNVCKCIYCDSELKVTDFSGFFNIDSYIPFEISREAAKKLYKNFCTNNILSPKIFKSNKTLKNIVGMYIPLIISDYISNGEIITEAEKISKWKSGNYNYKKTDLYNIFRSGSMNFENIPVSYNNKITDNIVESIHPYNYNVLNNFSNFKYSNFLFYKPNINLETLQKQTIEKTQKLYINVMKTDITGYDKVNLKDQHINLKNTVQKVVLVPVWFVKVKYNKQIYHFYINGQTGKISGNIPTSKLRVFNIFISLFLIFSIIMFLLEYLKVI